MKNLLIALALITAFAAPAAAETFPNVICPAKPWTPERTTPMKKIFLAIALVTAFAAPAMAETFPNVYMSR
jgi:hypothetical protein